MLRVAYIACIFGWASASFAAPLTYSDVASLVAAAEEGDRDARGAAIRALEANPGTPLAGAALGRLHALRSPTRSFLLTRFVELYEGFRLMNDYVDGHREDPLPRIWRAASAISSNYLLWDKARTQTDLEFASSAYRGDPDLPDHRPRCLYLLGMVEKDRGHLEQALELWGRAYAADPLGPAGKEAGRMLELFTG